MSNDNDAEVQLPTLRPTLMLEALVACISAGKPILLRGAPGTAKTALVTQACEMVGAILFVCHPVVDEPIDYKGFPFVVDGKAEFLPYGFLRQILDAKELTVVFLDDLGQASPAVQAAAMQLLLAREINGQKVSDFVTFISATNRKQDRAGVSGILEPVKSRYLTILEPAVDIDDWIDWAVGHGQPGENVAFIKSRPNLLNQFKPTADITNTPCPRTVAHCGEIICMNLGSEALEHAFFAGAAGVPFANELSAFLRIAREIIDPALALAKPEAVEIPEQPDKCYALAGAVAYQVRADTMNNFVTLIGRMEPEYSVLAMVMAKGRDPKLQETRAFGRWAKENQDVLI